MPFGKIAAAVGLIEGDKAVDSYKDAARRAFMRGIQQEERYDRTAKQVVAAGQMAAMEEKRQAEILASRAVAVAAAGGAAQDIDYIIADITGEGAYRASLALYESESEAERLRFEGDQARIAGADQSREYRARARSARIDSITNVFKVL